MTYNTEWIIRCIMDFCINGLGRSLVAYTFPIMLCVEGPLDFVKDCTAVLFISTLDDNDKIELDSILAKLKFAQYFNNPDHIDEGKYNTDPKNWVLKENPDGSASRYAQGYNDRVRRSSEIRA